MLGESPRELSDNAVWKCSEEMLVLFKDWHVDWAHVRPTKTLNGNHRPRQWRSSWSAISCEIHNTVSIYGCCFEHVSARLIHQNLLGFMYRSLQPSDNLRDIELNKLFSSHPAIRGRHRTLISCCILEVDFLEAGVDLSIPILIFSSINILLMLVISSWQLMHSLSKL